MEINGFSIPDKFKDNWIASAPLEPRKACPRESEEPLSRPRFSRGHALLRSNPETRRPQERRL
ncbi:MAG: hypothetical protein BGO67_11305 [Alphaproteobacteria bacterium 41-28]|nr:MAG: hypothetical protein BGO67_11305 [Alphaproteobacteria bacterium 41-28]